MKSVIVLIALVALTLARSNYAVDKLAFGAVNPPHIPTQAVSPGSTYNVPYYLGAFYSTTGSTSTWTLPLTYKNGGNITNGQSLIVVNFGPASVILVTSSPETIEGGASYTIPSGVTAEILSDYLDWQVVGVMTGSSAPVVSVVGTANQITSACASGVCTESLPSAILAPGSLRTTTYLAVGSPSVPSNVAAGAISTTRAAPVSQAFGAVTATGASGILTFTTTLAAASCATAVVTNTNVVANSQVGVNLQGYSGTFFTNGVPSVSRLDTSGSSVGSFTVQLCNTHASNALTGSVFISFLVIN